MVFAPMSASSRRRLPFLSPLWGEPNLWPRKFLLHLIPFPLMSPVYLPAGYLFSGGLKVLPASCRQIVLSRIASLCRQDVGSTLNR